MYSPLNRKQKYTLLYNLGFDKIQFENFIDFQNYVEMLNNMGIKDYTCTRTEIIRNYKDEILEINSYFMNPKFVNWGVSWSENYNQTVDKTMYQFYI